MKSYKAVTYDTTTSRDTIKQIDKGGVKPEINIIFIFKEGLISLFLTDSQELQETIFMKSYKVGTYDIPSSRYTIKQIANGRMKPEITVIFIF